MLSNKNQRLDLEEECQTKPPPSSSPFSISSQKMRPHALPTTQTTTTTSSSSSSSIMATALSLITTTSLHRSPVCYLPTLKHQRGGQSCQLTFTSCCSSSSSPNPGDDHGDQAKKKQDDLVPASRNEDKRKTAMIGRLLMGAEKVRESLRPKVKGDWKDVALMSLSFAIYVYISQRIVCAYCSWMDMLHQRF